MDRAELDSLAAEFMDADLANVVDCVFSGGTVRGSFSREYIETDQVAGVRSVILCPSSSVDTVATGDAVTVDGVNYTVQVIEQRGRAFTALVLGR